MKKRHSLRHFLIGEFVLLIKFFSDVDYMVKEPWGSSEFGVPISGINPCA